MERKPLILIVEDEKEIAKFIDLELQAENYDTIVSYDGVTGLSKFREHGPDLVVLDYMMPILDGAAMAKAMRSNPDHRDIPIIMTSAAMPTTEWWQNCWRRLAMASDGDSTGWM